MKFFHLGDLHFGKQVHDVPMADRDQPYWVEQFLAAVDRYQPDAVVIAGDVYDRRVPPPEAVKLFDHMLTELAKRDKYVFVIPGNHDSDVRLSYISGLLSDHKIYIAGETAKELTHVIVPDGDSSVTFWLMPYIFPKLVSDARVLGRDDLSTYDEAVRALLAEQQIDENTCNVLVAHQNVLANGTAPEHSDSETIIGGLGEIDVSAFEKFDYVALGHIHNMQHVGRETVRYAGCPLYYDFSEIGRRKDLTLVTTGPGKKISVAEIGIPLLHRMVQVTGTLEELLNQGISMKDRETCYIQAVIRDRHIPPHAMDRLREVYGESLINVKRERPEESGALPEGSDRAKTAALSLEEQFSAFYLEQQKELPDGEQEDTVRRILEQQSRRGNDYITEMKSIPEEDSEELIALLLNAGEEGSR